MKNKINDNLNNNIEIKYIIPLLALLAFVILNICITIKSIKNSNNNEILRLHVVANSNNISDQITKLKVNENIQEYLSNLNLNSLSNEEILNTLKYNSNEILEVADDTLKENNANYTSTLEIGKIMYEEKDNTLIHMDKGIYNSVKIVLGNGNGKNIWSFISPNKENLSKLQNYESIMPGISKIYNNNTKKEITYNSKVLEIIKYKAK